MNNNYCNPKNYTCIQSQSIAPYSDGHSSINSRHDHGRARRGRPYPHAIPHDRNSPTSINSNSIPYGTDSPNAFNANPFPLAKPVQNAPLDPFAASVKTAAAKSMQQAPISPDKQSGNPTGTYPRHKAPAPGKKQSPSRKSQSRHSQPVPSPGPIRRPLPAKVQAAPAPRTTPNVNGRFQIFPVNENTHARTPSPESPPPPYSERAPRVKTRVDSFFELICCLPQENL